MMVLGMYLPFVRKRAKYLAHLHFFILRKRSGEYKLKVRILLNVWYNYVSFPENVLKNIKLGFKFF